MADVRREKELAEKRKNEPQLDEQRDQLVRKIFTKFRKDRAPSTVLGMQQGAGATADENKAETSSGTVADASDAGSRPKVLPLVLRQQSDEQQQASSSTGVRPAAAAAAAPKKVSKWGKVLGGGGSTDSVDTSVVSQQSAPARIRDSPGRTSGGGGGGNGHKVFPKLQKVPTTAADSFVVGVGSSDQRQETIHETDERPARAEPEPEVEEVEEEKKETQRSSSAESPARNVDAPSPPPPPCTSMILPPPPDLDVLAKIEDLRADFKADVQSINQRLTGIEDMIQRIVDKLDVLAAAAAAPSMSLQPPPPPPPPGTPDVGRGCRTKSTDDLSSPMTPKLPPMVRRRRSKSRTRSSSSALPPMRPYSPRDTSPPPFPRSESLKKPCPPRPNDFL